jgi:hypothetical protein
LVFWLLCGDFNMIRKRIEKYEKKLFEFSTTLKFNTLISHLELYEFPLTNRKFTWSKSIDSNLFALLDNFFSSLEWCHHFNTSLI